MYEHYQAITFDLTDTGVLTVTFNRPDSLNSMDAVFHRELSTVFADISYDRRVRSVILTGAGRAFSAGGDLSWIQNEVRDDPESTIFEARKVVHDIMNVPQPIVAAVNGHAFGFGLTMALLSDVSIVSSDALLSDPHVAVGLVAGDGGAITWPLLVGMARAKRYLLTGDTINGATAAEWGLVTEACDASEVLDRARAMAERFAASPKAAIEGTKLALNAITKALGALTLDLSFAAERLSIESEEHRSIVDDLVEKQSQRRKASS